MTEHSYRLVKWTLGALILAIAPHVFRLPIYLSVLIAALLITRVVLHRRYLRMPPNWFKLILVAAIIALVLLEYKSINGVLAGGALLIGMVTLKTFELNTVRDHAGLMLAAVFIIASYVLDDTSIWSAIYMLIASSACVLALIKQSAPELSLTQLRPTAYKFMSYGIPVAFLLFLLFPRIPGGFFGLSLSSQAVTGLGDSLTPGSITDLIRSDELAFRARFNLNEPQREDLYWRGPVLHDFDGETWSRTKNFLPNSIGLISDSEKEITYEVIQEPTNKKWFYVLDYARDLPMDAYLTYDFQVMRERPITQLIKFKASAQLGKTNLMSDAEWQLALNRDLKLPENAAPQAKALAESWVIKYQNEIDIVNAAYRHFSQQNFSYTLRPKALRDDTIDDFLFRTQEGFCGHYASAFAVLMRHAGIPTRIVTGYLGGEKNLLDSYYRITQADAHAWTEVYLKNKGWTRVDPTAAIAPERIEQRLEDMFDNENLGGLFGDVPLFLRLENAWFALNTAWYNQVLDFNAEKQLDLIKKLGFKNPNKQTLILLLVGSILFGALLMTFNFWRQARKRPLDPVQKIYLTLRQRLIKNGLEEVAHEGPRDLLARAKIQFPDSSIDIENFIELYIQSRYFSADLNTQNNKTLKKYLKHI